MNSQEHSVYGWDSNCQRIHDSLAGSFSHMEKEIGELEATRPPDLRNLLYYFKKWHYNNQLFLRTREEIIARKRVIESLLVKGYGVSTALSGDLGEFQKALARIHRRLQAAFSTNMELIKSQMYLPPSQEGHHNSPYIIRELCRRLGDDPEGNIPTLGEPPRRIAIELFLRVTEETPPHTHMTILNRMFLELAEESNTIMEGTIGLSNVDSPQYLKFLASRNLRELFTYLYETLGEEVTLDVNWIKRIHYFLTRDLDTSHTWKAGEFREEDFQDQAGLTFAFGNFERGIAELGEFLATTDWHTESLQKFIGNLARLYYMLLAIHPFLDSNGRTAKCLINHLLLRRGLTPLLYNVHEEILCLPRYGGSLLMMGHYFQGRLARSLDRYFFERERIARSGNLEKHFFRTDFDAGFYFRHLNGLFPLVEVDFTISIIPREDPLFQDYINRCRIVIPREDLLGDLLIYNGFTREGSREWEMTSSHRPHSLWKNGPDSHGFYSFSATVFIEVSHHLACYHQLEVSCACPSEGLTFTNKSLNYCFSLERPYLIKLVGEHLAREILSDGAFEHESLAALRRLRDALEKRAWELIDHYGLHEPQERLERRAAVAEAHRDLPESFRSAFLPLLSRFIISGGFTGKGDPADSDNGILLSCLIENLTPAAASLLGHE